MDVDGVGLTGILVHVGVHELNDISTDGGGHDIGESGLAGLGTGEGEDGDEGTGGHSYVLCCICDPQMRSGLVMLLKLEINAVKSSREKIYSETNVQ